MSWLRLRPMTPHSLRGNRYRGMMVPTTKSWNGTAEGGTMNIVAVDNLDSRLQRGAGARSFSACTSNQAKCSAF